METQYPFDLAVARPVSRKEIATSDEAEKAEQREWNRLRDRKVWDESVIRDWFDVQREYQNKGQKVHLAFVFGICVEKGSELPKNDPGRKMKYRVVFGGHQVVDEWTQAAQFDDLGSSPATLESSRACDMYGCLQGHDIEMADAEQAYVQALLTGVDTWVCLPPEARVGDKWKKWNYKGARPVVRLRLALYGHPDAGTCWERHCDTHLKSEGFQPISEVWSSYYWHPQLRFFLLSTWTTSIGRAAREPCQGMGTNQTGAGDGKANEAWYFPGLQPYSGGVQAIRWHYGNHD